MLDERLPYLEVKKISDLLDPSDNLDLLAANGTSIPYKGWTEIDLKGNSGFRTSWAQMKEHEKFKGRAITDLHLPAGSCDIAVQSHISSP